MAVKGERTRPGLYPVTGLDTDNLAFQGMIDRDLRLGDEHSRFDRWRCIQSFNPVGGSGARAAISAGGEDSSPANQRAPGGVAGGRGFRSR